MKIHTIESVTDSNNERDNTSFDQHILNSYPINDDPYNIKNLTEEQIENRRKERTKNFIFRSLIETKIVDSFEKELNNAGYTEEEINEFEMSMAELGNEDPLLFQSLLATPYEQKVKAKNILPSIREGKISISEYVRKLAEQSQKEGREIAYHSSNENIKPNNKAIDGKGGRILNWSIHGTEADHRDNDLYMAYYSKDYMHLYREKNPKYLYAVVFSNKKGSGHRVDKSGNWGRAPSLDIIEKFDIQEIDSEVNELMMKIAEENLSTKKKSIAV